MPCEIFFRDHFNNNSNIDMMGSGRVELVSMGMHFNNCGSLCASVLGH